MKRIYLIALFLSASGLCWGERFANTPIVNSHSSDAVAISSVSCADNTTIGSQVVISSYSAELFIVNITTPGTGVDPYVQLFDNSLTTSGARALTSPITSKTIQQWFFDIATTSNGITSRNQGGACVTYSYRER